MVRPARIELATLGLGGLSSPKSGNSSEHDRQHAFVNLRFGTPLQPVESGRVGVR